MKKDLLTFVLFTATSGFAQVTSFSAGPLSPLFTTNVATPNTTPYLTFSLSTTGAYSLLANCTGSSSTPSFTSLYTCVNQVLLAPGPIGIGTGVPQINITAQDYPASQGGILNITCFQFTGGGGYCRNGQFTTNYPGAVYGGPGFDSDYFGAGTQNSYDNGYMYDYGAGQHDLLNYGNFFVTGPGDTVGLTIDTYSRNACIEGSDECEEGLHLNTEELPPWTGVVVTGGTGATSLTTGSGSNFDQGLLSPLLDLNTSVSGTASYAGTTNGLAELSTSFTVGTSVMGTMTATTFSGVVTKTSNVITAVSSTSGMFVGQLLTDANSALANNSLITAIGFGPCPCTITVSQAAVENSPSETITAGGVDIPAVSPNTTLVLSNASAVVNLTTSTALTTSSVCVVGPGGPFEETFQPSFAPTPVGGVQQITATFYFSHPPGSVWYCGGAAGDYLELSNLAIANFRYVERVFGSIYPSTLIVGHQVPNGFTSVWYGNVGTQNVNLIQGAMVTGVLNPSTESPDGTHFVVEANAVPWAASDNLLNANNIAAGYTGQHAGDFISNPYASHLFYSVSSAGLGGAFNEQHINGVLQYMNGVSTANTYIGAGGTQWSAPWMFEGEGYVSAGLYLQYAPLPGGYGAALTNCPAGVAVCVGELGPGSTFSEFPFLEYGYYQDNLSYDTANRLFDIADVNGLKINGSYACTAANISSVCGASSGGITGTLTTNYFPLATGTSTVGNGHLVDGIVSAYGTSAAGWLYSPEPLMTSIVGANASGGSSAVLVLTGEAAQNEGWPDNEESISLYSYDYSGSAGSPGQIYINGQSAVDGDGMLFDTNLSGGNGGIAIGYARGSHPAAGLSLNSGYPLNLQSTNLIDWNGDTGLSRDSAGVLDVGNGTAANKSGSLNASNVTIGNHLLLSSTSVPALTSCTGGSVANGGDNAFHITGLASTTTCTATFSANLPLGVCTANAWGSGGTPYLVATISSASHVILGFSTSVTDMNVTCF